MRRITLIAALGILATACGVNTSMADVEGAWELGTGTHDGRQIPTLQSHPITLTIDSQGLGGTAACNSYGGRYEMGVAGSFSVGALAVTEMACMPTDVMEAEQRFLAGLADITRISRDGDTLTLTGPKTELVFALLPPVPTADLVGTVWILDGLISGGAVSSVMGDRATLVLNADGTFTGGTGCRSISGEYVVSGAEVQFTNFAADGECTPELQSQDGQVVSALEGGFRVEIDGDRLTTRSAGDEGLSFKAEA